MSFTKRKEAIIRCGADRELVLIFNCDLKAYYLKVGAEIPLPVFRSIICLRDARKVLKKHPDIDFYLLMDYFEKILERNYGELPPTLIEL